MSVSVEEMKKPNVLTFKSLAFGTIALRVLYRTCHWGAGVEKDVLALLAGACQMREKSCFLATVNVSQSIYSLRQASSTSLPTGPDRDVNWLEFLLRNLCPRNC